MFFTIAFAQAQPWMQSLKTKTPNFFEMQKAFNDYWKDKKVEKGKEYKQFRRWEWYWSQRVNEKGEFPKSDVLLTEQLKYNETHPVSQMKSASSSTTASWTFMGPSTSGGGYSGIGRLNCIAFHPTDINTFWVGAPAGGLWKTTNGGASWTTNTDNLPVLGVSDIVIDPSNPNIIFIATGDGEGAYSLFNGAGDTKSIGILKSTNGGSSWTTVLSASVTSNTLIRRLIMDPSNSQVLLAATSLGIFRTINGGNTWNLVSTADWFIDIEFKPTDSNIAYATTFDWFGDAQIFRSINNGLTWNQVTSFTGYNRINVEVSANSPAYVSAVCSSTSNGLGGLWSSNNSGASFTQYLTGDCTNNMLSWSDDGSGCGGQGRYDLSHAINPSNANEMFLGGVNTWKTLNAGTTWSINNVWSSWVNNIVPEVHADKHYLAYHPLNNSKVFECNDGGVYVTNDGGVNWSDLSAGLGISQIYRIGTSATVANEVLCGLQDNGSKELSAGVWTDQTGGDGMESIIDYTNNNIKYATYVYGEISKTTDGGANWNVIAQNGGTGVDGNGQWVTPYIMHPTNNNILLVGKDQVYETTDGGATWNQLGTLPGITDDILSMAYAPSNPNVIYVATPSQFFKTTNGGSTWTLVGTSVPRITYIAVDPLNPQKVWQTRSGFTAGNKVWYSSNGGGSWTNISGTLPNVPMNCIVYENGTSDALYIGTDLGVYYRNSSMSDWIPFNTGLPNVVVNELEISYNNNKLWAATFGRGLWNSNLYCVNPLQSTAINGLNTFCDLGAGTSFTANPVAGATSYTWTLPVGWSGSSNTNTINVLLGGSGVISVVAGNTCGISPSQSLAITINPLPVINTISSNSLICVGENATLTASGAQTYTWDNGSNTSSIVVSPSVTTVYSVTAEDVNGCSNSNTLSLSVDPCAGINEQYNQISEMTIYPNPFNEKITVVFKGNPELFQIYNVLGSVIYSSVIKESKTEIDLSDQAKGIYFIKAGSLNKKLIKE